MALCASVTISYGVLYYAFTVLAPAISADTGWSPTAVTGAFSAGSLTGAVAGIAAGRLLQRRGPRLVMTPGGVLGAAAVAVVGAPLAAALGEWFGWRDTYLTLAALALVPGPALVLVLVAVL